VTQADLQSALGFGTVVRNSSVAAACGGFGAYLWDGTTFQSWTVRCSAPDSPANYQRIAASYADPYVYYSDAVKRVVNDPAKPVFWASVNNTQCWNATTKAFATAVKCQYLPSSSGPSNYDIMSVPASWNATARTATVSKSDLKALSPLASEGSYTNTICGRSFYVAGTTSAYYTLVCQ